MADTITVLNGIQFEKDTDDDVYTLDGENLSVVSTQIIPLPISVSGARVIFNGNYDPDGGRCHVRVKVTKITALTGGLPSKTEAIQALEWSTVTPPAMLETGAIDVSDAIEASLHIDICLSSVTASTGLEAVVQVRSEASLDEWTTLSRYLGPVGTGQKADFADTEAAGQTVLSVTNPATADLDHIGKFIFLEDTNTIAQCEIAWLVSQSGD